MIYKKHLALAGLILREERNFSLRFQACSWFLPLIICCPSCFALNSWDENFWHYFQAFRRFSILLFFDVKSKLLAPFSRHCKLSPAALSRIFGVVVLSVGLKLEKVTCIFERNTMHLGFCLTFKISAVLDNIDQVGLCCLHSFGLDDAFFWPI